MDEGLVAGTRLWRLANIEYDERIGQLRVDGMPRALEPIPRALLMRLLERGDAPVLRADLARAGWGNVDPNDPSIHNAMSKLRRALGGTAGALIEAVGREGPRLGYGYRLKQAAMAAPSPTPGKPLFAFAAGDPVPGRPPWRLAERLAREADNDVWIAVNPGTGERHVFAFAVTVPQVEALRRMLDVASTLRAVVGATAFVPIVDADLDAIPAWLESEYAGLDLERWAAARGGLDAVPLAIRIGIVADVAEAVSQAHGLGVLHGNLCPANILVAGTDGALRVRLVGFGERSTAGAIQVGADDPASHDAAADRPSEDGNDPPTDIAPGAPLTTGGDIHALGILLYQMAAGAFNRMPGPHWEANVPDPLVRQDIAEAAADEVAARMGSAAALAARLHTLDARRAVLDAQAAEAAAAARRQREDELRLRRRPFVRAAWAAVLLGLCCTSMAALIAFRERNEAARQSATAVAVNQFMSEDLLGRDDPAKSGNPNETLVQATVAAEPMIEQCLEHQPRLAAALYVMLGGAFSNRDAFDQARHAYERAEVILSGIESAHSADVVIVRLRRAEMEAASAQSGSLKTSAQIVSEVSPYIDTLGPRRSEAETWLLFATSIAQGIKGARDQAVQSLAAAVKIDDANPAEFGSQLRFKLHANLGKQLMLLGKYAQAEAVLTPLLVEQMAIHGARHPNTLFLEANLAVIPLLDGNAALALQRLSTVYPAVLSVYGPTDRATISALSERAEAYLFLGRYKEAAADFDEGYRRGLATLGKLDFYTFSMHGSTGTAECRGGLAADGMPKMRDTYAISSSVLGVDSAITQSSAGDLAMCMLQLDRPVDAQKLMDTIDCKKTGSFIGQPDYCAQMDVQLAALEMQTGRSGSARALATGALQNFPPHPADPYYRQWALRIIGKDDSDGK